MAYESIKVDIIPGAENVEVLHFSQFDNKRPFFIELFNGGAEFIPEEGMTITLECRKRDGNIVIISNPVVTDNVAEFSTTEQLTACYGDNESEIKIVDENDLVIGSANFIINVEKSPTCGGLVSESEIDNLTQQIEEITQEVIGEDYYNKTEVDNLLDEKADISDLPDMSHYYTKTQTDNLLNNKADVSDLATLASKAEVTQAILDEDISLKNWASSHFATPGYVSTHYYSKLQVDDIINNMLPVGSASGNPCTFDTEIEAALQSLTAEIVASGGNGTPSNPIPIVGHSELNLNVNGQTFTVAFGQTVYGGVYDKSGRLTITHSYVDLGTCVWGGGSDVGGKNLFTVAIADIKRPDTTSTLPNWKIEGYELKTQVEALNYNNVYSGLGWFDGVAFWTTDYTAAQREQLKSDMSGVHLCYELATPIVIDVSEMSIDTIVGVNNITSDGDGDVTVSYKDSIQHYIDSRI